MDQLPHQSVDTSTSLEQVSWAVEQEKELNDDVKMKLQGLAQEVISKIQSDKDFYTKQGADEMAALWESLKNKSYLKAFVDFLKLLFNSFSLSSKGGFQHLETEIQKLDLSKKNLAELKNLISHFEHAISENKDSISDLTDQTFLMSLCKDRALELRCAERGLQAPSPYDKLSYHLHTPASATVGKVLLFNRWGGKLKNNGIQDYAKNTILVPRIQALSGSGFQHAVLVSKVDSDGTLYITHANQDGVIEEKLSDYLARGNTQVDVMSLDLPEDYRTKVVDFAKSKHWAKYDTMGMAYDAMIWARGEWGAELAGIKNCDDMFYCSELIFSGLEASWYEIDKKLIAPGDFLKVLKPQYCSSLSASDLSSHLSFDQYQALA